MARPGKVPDRRGSPAVVASARRVKLDDPMLKLRKASDRQALAWDMYDRIGEVKNAVNFRANALSRLRLFVARRPGPGEEPVPLEPGEVPVATAALEGLESDMGGHSEILRRLTTNLDVPGECYLVGLGARPGRPGSGDPGEPESWDIRSVDELYQQGAVLFLKEDPDQPVGQGRRIDPELDFVARIWIRHPRFSNLPDSPLIGVLTACDRIVKVERATNSILVSRAVQSGFLKVPDGLSFAGDDESVQDSGAQAPEGSGDPFLDELMETMTAAIADPGSAAAVVPMVVRGDKDELEQFGHFVPDRPFDEKLMELETGAIRRLAQGFNLPVEVVLGHMQTTFANAMQIDKDKFKDYLEPSAVAECDALTVAYLRPYLEDAGRPDAGEFIVWYDPGNLVVSPNRTEDAFKLHDRIVISDEALRRTTDFTDEDAPDPLEVEDRIRRKAAGRPAFPGQEPAEERPAEEQPSDDEEGEGAATASALPALAAAGEDLSGLASRLVGIDRSLKQRLESAADAALRKVLDRLGARIRTKASRAVRASLDGVPNREVARHLGPSMVASVGLDEQEQVRGAFAELGSQFERWVELAVSGALALVPGLSESERADQELRLASERRDARAWLEGAMEALALARLFDPEPDPPEVGEYDSTVLVPFQIVREAVARAGGAASPEAGATVAAGADLAGVILTLDRDKTAIGLTTGWLMRTLFSDHGVRTEGYEWVYGEYPRTSPFEPHMELDGARFANFDDPVLENVEGWPPEPFYIPGDHDGCHCDFMPILVGA